MSWNYRVCKERYPEFDSELHDPDDEFTFSIRSVYYADSDTDETQITLTSVKAVSPFGISIEALKSDIELITAAFRKPMIDLDTIVYVEITDEVY